MRYQRRDTKNSLFHQNASVWPDGKQCEKCEPPDTKEIFIYKLLQHVGIGPEAHFIVPIHGAKRTLYIITKDCHFVLLSKLTEVSANTKTLVQLDLISRILCLCDCLTNSGNCGQVDDKPMIIDFGIVTQSRGYVKSDILDEFYQGNDEFNYSGLRAVPVRVQKQEKLNILKESLQEWKLLDNIERTVLEVNTWVQKLSDKIEFEDDLQRYAEDVRATVEILSKAVM